MHLLFGTASKIFRSLIVHCTPFLNQSQELQNPRNKMCCQVLQEWLLTPIVLGSFLVSLLVLKLTTKHQHVILCPHDELAHTAYVMLIFFYSPHFLSSETEATTTMNYLYVMLWLVICCFFILFLFLLHFRGITWS